MNSQVALNSNGCVEMATGKCAKAKLGLFDGISTIFGLMVGSGIFSSVKEIQGKVGSPGMTIVVWLLTGLLSLAGALCYAELGTLIPGSGGEAQYLQKAFGSWATFVFNWTSIALLKPGTVAILTVICAKYSLRLAYSLAGVMDVSDTIFQEKAWAVKVIAITACFLVTAAAAVSPRVSLKMQEVMTFGKIAALAFIILMSGYYLAFKETATLMSNLGRPFEGTLWQVTEYAPAFNHGLFSYDGWNNLNIISGDLANPGTTLPLAIWLSMAMVVVLYMFTIVGYYAVLPASLTATTPTIGVEFGRAVLGHFGAVLMPFFVVNSTFGSALSSMATSSEIVILAADSGHIPPFFGHINRSLGTALNAYILQLVLSIFFVLISDFDGLVNIYSMPTWIFYAACVVVLLLMRVREPHATRPYRVWMTTPVLFLIACMFLLVTSLWAEPYSVGASILVTLLGIPVYFFFIKK